MRITSKYNKIKRHTLHSRLKTASHRFALMVDNYSPDDTEAQNGLLMVTGKVFVPGYTDATVTIVYPKRKRDTDQSFYYITPTESTEDMSLAYSDDTFYPRFSDCEQAVKDLPEVTVSQYFYDQGIIPDDPSTFTALTGIPLESSLVDDINEITGEDDAYYPPEGSNLQNLITQGILIADDPTVPYYYLTNETPHTVLNGITDSHIFVDPNVVASQMIIIVKRSDQHVEYNTSESTGDANGWELVLTSSFAPDSIWTISYDSFNAIDADLQLDRFSELLHKKCAQYGWMYISDLSYQTWVEQYANNFLTLASHEADLAIDDHFSQQCAEGDPWYIRYNDDKTLKYFSTSLKDLGLDKNGVLLFVTKEGEEYCETLDDHILNENSKPSSPLFTVDSLTLNSQTATPIVACIYFDSDANSLSYLPLPSSLASTLSMTTNFIQQLASIQAAAHDIDALIDSLTTMPEEQEEEEEDTSRRPPFADSSWTQSSDFPTQWISPLYTAPEEPSCMYQIVWDASTEQESVNTSDGEEVAYAQPTDIIYHTLNGQTLNGFIWKYSYVLGGVKNSGDWDSLAEPVRQTLLYVNEIDRINNSSPLLPLEEQMKLLRSCEATVLPDVAQPLDYWTLLTGASKPKSIWNLGNMIPAWHTYIRVQGEDVEFTWDPDHSGYDTPFNVLTFNSNRNSNLSILKDLPWGLVFQDTSYSEQPECITQIASIFDSFESIETNIENNLTRILNQTLELADSENNGNWLEMQEKYMSSLTAFSKSNESSSSQLVYEYMFSTDQLQSDTRVSSILGSATLRLIFDGDRQELTPELIATAAYDDTLTVTIQNTRLTNMFSNLIGQAILSGLMNNRSAEHLEKVLTSDGYLEPILVTLLKGQAQLKPFQQEAALIQLAESLEKNEDIAWDNLSVSGFTSRNIFWYCKQYANDPYISAAINNCLNALSDVLQNNACIPASGSRKLAGSVKNKYYLPVITGVKNMLPAYVQLELSASKTGTVAYIDDSVLYFTTGNTYVSKVDGGELVTFGDDEQPGFKINEKLENVSDLFNVIAEVVSQPIRLLEEEEDNLADYVSDQQLYSQDYMDQYYSDGLLAHHINRR